MQSMDNATILAIISSIMSLGGLVGGAIALYTAKAQRKNINAQGDNFIASGAKTLVEGAEVSGKMLLDRIEEIEHRYTEREKEFLEKEAAFQERDEAREMEYGELSARFKTMEEEMLQWKDYAFRLIYQVKSFGKDPVPFVPEELSKVM